MDLKQTNETYKDQPEVLKGVIPSHLNNRLSLQNRQSQWKTSLPSNMVFRCQVMGRIGV